MNEHPTLMYCAFESFIFEIDGNWYVQEDYQDGEIWSEEEIWGSTLYDLENKRKLEWPVYISPDDWIDYIYREDDWEDMYEFEDKYGIYNEAIEYYKNEIEKLKHENNNAD